MNEQDSSQSSWIPAITASLGAFLLIGNLSMLTLGATAITNAFGDPLLVTVALAIAGLVNASLVVTGGKIGYMNGLKRAILIGLIIFIIGNILCGLSLNGLMFLVSFAIIMPIGYILAFPATGSLLIATYDGKQRNIAFGLYAGFIGLTAALAPLLMGILATFIPIIGWRLMFAYQIGLAIILIPLLRAFAETEKYPSSIDWIGTLLLILAFAPIILGLSLLTTDILYSTLIVVGVLFFGVFWMWSNRLDTAGRNPIFRVLIFSNRVFRTGVIYILLFTLAAGGAIVLIPQILQTLGFSAFDTALIMLVYTLPVFFVALVSGNLGERFPPKYLILTGTVFGIVGLSVLFVVPSLPLITIMGLLLLVGIGGGLILPYIQNIALSSVDVANVGEATGMYMSFQELGAATGAAIIAALASLAGYVFIAGILLALGAVFLLPQSDQAESE